MVSLKLLSIVSALTYKRTIERASKRSTYIPLSLTLCHNHTDILLFFGFQSQTEFFRDELHFYFDCLFRGLMNLVITKGERLPKYRGYYVNHQDIAKLVKKVFPERTE